MVGILASDVDESSEKEMRISTTFYRKVMVVEMA